MRKFLTLVLTMAVCLAASSREFDFKTVDGDPMGVRIYTLDNGLKVYMSVNKEQPRVTAHIAVNTGSRNDPAEYTGLAHYLEHLMFKGSHRFGTTDYEAERPYIEKITSLYEEYSRLTDPEERKAKYHEIDSVSQIAAGYNIPNEYDKLMALVGGTGSNAYTWFDITCYTEDIPSNEIDRWARIQSDRFQNLVLRGFHTELEAVYEEKNISLASDEEKAFDAFMAELFPTHSYGTQTTIGTQEHLKNPSLVAIQDYYNRYYVPNNIAIVMAGDLDPDETIAIIDKHFSSWKPGEDNTPREFGPQPVFDSPQETFVLGQEEESVTMGWRFDGAASLQNDTLQMLSSVLFNQKAGLIDLDLNQKMALQEAYCDVLLLKDYSALMLSATPNEGQSLPDVRALLLSEIGKLKRGEFSDDLLASIINNEKLSYLKGLEHNSARVSQMVDAFINAEPWDQHVARLERMARITKKDIVDFANKYLTDGYAYVEKRQGQDESVKKIEKPQITPIPANREYSSQFFQDMAAETVEPIHPQFVDFDRDLTVSSIGSLPLVYKRNTENDLFTMMLHYGFGCEADNRYEVAADYVDLLGTNLMKSEDIKKKFYNLAASYSVNVSGKTLDIYLSGLQENMQEALVLLEDLLLNAVPDTAVYSQYVGQTLKARADAKTNQRSGFYRMWEYALHGERNAATNIMSEEDLKAADPKTFTDLLKGLLGMRHSVLYYGPATEEELSQIITSTHRTPAVLADVPQNVPYEWKGTPVTEVLIAPYEAKNIYMRMLHQEGRQFDVQDFPVMLLFNEYFGGGMNTIVFQELRETRGLAYNAGAAFVGSLRKGEPEYSYLHIISQNDKMMDCINVFHDIVEDMPQNASALSIARENLMKGIAAKRVTKFNVISTYVRNKELGVDQDVDRLTYEKLPSLTMQDVTDFEQDRMAGKPLRYVIFGDEKELDMEALEKIGPVRRLSLEEIFGY